VRNAIVIPIGALRRILALVLILAVLIVVVLAVRTQVVRSGIATLFSPGAGEVIDHSAYQAVFLTNGSTYFGKLEPQGDDWFLLSDTFYLSTSDQTGTQLIKRGNEAQGPKEPMIISRTQVLFIENLRDDSDIVGLIKKFKSGQLPTATVAPVTPTSARPAATPSASPTR
jgi:hypothetical protein